MVLALVYAAGTVRGSQPLRHFLGETIEELLVDELGQSSPAALPWPTSGRDR